MKPTSFAFYSRQAMQTISHEMKSDFSIIVGDKTYPVRSFVAANFSKLIFQLTLEDISLSKLVLKTKGDFTVTHEYLSGKTVQITPENYQSTFLFACELNIASLANLTYETMFAHATPDTLLNNLIICFESKMDCEYLVNAIAEKFLEVSKFLDTVPCYILQLILQNALVTEHEEEIANLLLNYSCPYHNKKCPRVWQYLPPINFAKPEFASLITDHNLNFNYIRSILLRNRKPLIKKQKVPANFVFSPSSGCIQSGIIQAGYKPIITSDEPFSDRYSPANLITKDDFYFCSKTGPLSSIYFNFAPYKIGLTAYTLRSWRIGANGVAPKTWSVHVQVDGAWVEVDKQTNNTDLVANSKAAVYEIKSIVPASSFIRFTQIESNNSYNQRLALSFIEFFGSVVQK